MLTVGKMRETLEKIKLLSNKLLKRGNNQTLSNIVRTHRQ